MSELEDRRPEEHTEVFGAGSGDFYCPNHAAIYHADAVEQNGGACPWCGEPEVPPHE